MNSTKFLLIILTTNLLFSILLVQRGLADVRPTFIRMSCDPHQHTAIIFVIHEDFSRPMGRTLSIDEIAEKKEKMGCLLDIDTELDVTAFKSVGSPKGDALTLLANKTPVFRHSLSFDVDKWEVRVTYKKNQNYAVAYCPDYYDQSFEYLDDYSGGVGKCMVDDVLRGRTLASHILAR